MRRARRRSELGRGVVTPQQSAAAKAELAHDGLPQEFTHLLGGAAGALRPQTSAEVKTLRSLLLDTTAFKQAIVHATPTRLGLSGVLAFRSLASTEDRVAAALQSFANDILTPATTKQVHPA